MLDNVKTELNLIKANPKFKDEIELTINIFYFNFGAAPVLILPAALPVNLQIPLPVYLFGLTDLYGGYNKFQNLIPLLPPWVFVVDMYRIFWYTNLFPGVFIANFLRQGDLYYVFQFGIFVALVRIRCNNLAYGTFLNSFVSDLMTINTIRYIIPVANINQFDNSLTFAYQNQFGKTFTDTLDPKMFITNRDMQPNICDIPIDLPIDKNMMMGFYMNFDCPEINMILFVEQYEPLTYAHKYN